MSALEEIEAAIEKLEQMRTDAHPAPWGPVRREEHGGGYWAHLVLGDAVTLDVDFNDRHDLADANLIVTLHRTIEAQLVILQNLVENLRDFPAARADYIADLFDDVMALARAINGTP